MTHTWGDHGVTAPHNMPHLPDHTRVDVDPGTAALIRETASRLHDAGPLTVREAIAEAGHTVSLDAVRSVLG